MGFDHVRVLRVIEARTETVQANLADLDRFVSGARLSDPEMTIVEQQMHAAEQSMSAMAAAVSGWRQYGETAWHGATAAPAQGVRRRMAL